MLLGIFNGIGICRGNGLFFSSAACVTKIYRVAMFTSLETNCFVFGVIRDAGKQLGVFHKFIWATYWFERANKKFL